MELLSIFFALFFRHFLFCSTAQAADIGYIYGAENARTFWINNLNTVSLMWDESRPVDSIMRSQKSHGNFDLGTILYGIVVASRGIWMFEVSNKYVRGMGLDSVKDILALLDTGPFKQEVRWRIFGDKMVSPENGNPPFRPTLAEFLETNQPNGQRQSVVPTYAFIIQRREGQEGGPKNERKVLATALQLEKEVNDLRIGLEELEVQWLPFPEGRGQPIQAVGFGVNVIHKDKLSKLQVPGQQVEIIFGKETCLLGEFPDKPKGVLDYYIKPSDNMQSITTDTMEAELAHLWIKDTENVHWIVPQQGRDMKAASASLLALDNEWWWSIVKHDNHRYPTWGVTVVTTFGSWTILFPWQSINDMWNSFTPKNPSLKYVQTHAGFREFVKQNLETGHPGGSIEYTWQRALQDLREKFAECREDQAKLLDIFIFYQCSQSDPIPKEEFFRALVLEMLRIVEVENEKAGGGDMQMVDANGGTTEKPRALDITEWMQSRTVRFVSVNKPEIMSTIQGHFLVHEEYKENLFSFDDGLGNTVKEAGYILKLFYGTRFRAKWEIGLSGKVKRYAYDNPNRLIRPLELADENEEDAMDIDE